MAAPCHDQLNVDIPMSAPRHLMPTYVQGRHFFASSFTLTCDHTLLTYLLTYAHRPSWGIGRRQQIARVPCPGPSSLTGSRCSPSSWCLPGGPVATCFLVVLFSVCLEDSMSALAWWCLLLVFGASGQSRPIFFF